MKTGFIGLGNMATAMISGIIKEGIVEPEEILGSSRTKESLNKAVDAFGIRGLENNTRVAEEADILILAVKPQMYEKVIKEIRQSLKDSGIIVSIAPGKTIEWLKKALGDEKSERKIVRCMPNTPAMVGEGCTGVSFSENMTEDERKLVLKVLGSFGKAMEVPESLMDVVVGVSGSSPAYVFLFIEAMADAAVADGMPRKQAYEFASQAVLGAAKMVQETGLHPGELKVMVCSPGGTTIEAVRVLEEKGLRSGIIEAQRACVKKSKEM